MAGSVFERREVEIYEECIVEGFSYVTGVRKAFRDGLLISVVVLDLIG